MKCILKLVIFSQRKTVRNHLHDFIITAKFIVVIHQTIPQISIIFSKEELPYDLEVSFANQTLYFQIIYRKVTNIVTICLAIFFFFFFYYCEDPSTT